MSVDHVAARSDGLCPTQLQASTHTGAGQPVQERAPAGAGPNRTGLPDRLKMGVETLSGLALDDVRVRFGSAEPARVQALAFARNREIHLAPGQERHLPHEAWHVVQQRRGRVRPTLHVAGAPVNDDPALEREADVMGGRAMALGASYVAPPVRGAPSATLRSHAGALAALRPAPLPIIQRVDGLPGRLLTAAYSDDPRRMIGYWGGWVADVVDLASRGYLYDSIALMYSVLGSTGATVASRAEELLRFAQNHPEIMDMLGYGAPALAEMFGLPLWVVQLVVSRGEAADLIGSIAFSMIPEDVRSAAPTLMAGLVRRGGRSLLNRVLGAAAAVIPVGAVSFFSRVLHGFAVTGGDTAAGTAPNLPGDAFWFDLVARRLMPVERLHIIPARRGGPMTEANAAYGAAGSNTLMIPLEAADIPAVAIRTPAGTLEAMIMNNGLFLARGIRPLASAAEQKIARDHHLA